MAWSKYDSTGAALEGALTDFPVGSVVSWAADSPPSGWLKCDGTAINRVAYPELFSVIGTQYGTGNGSTTFNLPTSDGEIILAVSMTARLGVASDGGNLFIYGTEALRDAAIPAPAEGQRAYITGSTIAAATGATTMVPTGIQTIYNGAAWVCVTDVGANTPADGTTTSLSFTATLSGSPGTNPSVTLATGTTALVSVKCQSGTNNAGYTAFTGVAVSGATTKAATMDDSVMVFGNPTYHQIGITYVISGLTAGTNTFTMQYSTNSGTSTHGRRALTVRGIA